MNGEKLSVTTSPLRWLSNRGWTLDPVSQLWAKRDLPHALYKFKDAIRIEEQLTRQREGDRT